MGGRDGWWHSDSLKRGRNEMHSYRKVWSVWRRESNFTKPLLCLVMKVHRYRMTTGLHNTTLRLSGKKKTAPYSSSIIAFKKTLNKAGV